MPTLPRSGHHQFWRSVRLDIERWHCMTCTSAFPVHCMPITCTSGSAPEQGWQPYTGALHLPEGLRLADQAVAQRVRRFCRCALLLCAAHVRPLQCICALEFAVLLRLELDRQEEQLAWSFTASSFDFTFSC
eukprot:6128953-Amphidinium_carterae.1